MFEVMYSKSFFFLCLTAALSSMSTSKKARVSSPADEEMKELRDKYGCDRCDGLANSLKTTRNKPVTGMSTRNTPRYLLLLLAGV